MPRALMPCRQPACEQLVAGGGYCTEHKRPAFAGENRTELPRHWNVIRARILRRDRRRCRRCGAPFKTVDHVMPRSLGGSDDDSNLVTLCDYHTRLKDADDAARGRALSRGRQIPGPSDSGRPSESHPH